MGIRAFAAANLLEAEYWVVGDGPESESLSMLAQDLGIAQQVKFWGRLPREETLNKLAECHVLVHPSLHDSGGWVCTEAMGAGRPVICLDLGGPATQVTEETGFKIPAESPEQAVQDLAKAIVTLSKEPELRIRMGEAGKKLVGRSRSWQAKGEQLAALYEQVTLQEGKNQCVS